MARLRVPSALLALAVATAASSAGAQVTAEAAIDTAREVYGPAEADQGSEPCPAARADEIVVCREIVEDDRYRVRSPTDEAIAAGAAVDDGLPRAPDVFGMKPCKAYQFCGSVGRTPTHPLLIDLKAIPEAPPGSDAARYAERRDGAPGPAPEDAPAPDPLAAP